MLSLSFGYLWIWNVLLREVNIQRFRVRINKYIWGLFEQFVAKFQKNFRAGEEKTLFSLICACSVRPAWIQRFAIFHRNVSYVSELNPFFTQKVLHLLKKKKHMYAFYRTSSYLYLYFYLYVSHVEII